jgi:hypothetical protein
MADDTAEEALKDLAVLHSMIARTREEIKAEVEARYDSELFALQRMESLAANRARDLGASLSRVGKAMGTTDWRTIKERLALASEEEEK